MAAPTGPSTARDVRLFGDITSAKIVATEYLNITAAGDTILYAVALQKRFAVYYIFAQNKSTANDLGLQFKSGSAVKLAFTINPYSATNLAIVGLYAAGLPILVADEQGDDLVVTVTGTSPSGELMVGVGLQTGGTTP